MNEVQSSEATSGEKKGGQMGSEASAQQVIDDLSTSAWAFSVLVSALEVGMLEALAAPASLADLSRHSGIPIPLAKGILDTLVALSLLQNDGEVYSSAPTLLQGPFRNSFLASIRSTSLQSRQFITDARSHTLAPGWFHTDPEILLLNPAGGVHARLAGQPAEQQPKLISWYRPHASNGRDWRAGGLSNNAPALSMISPIILYSYISQLATARPRPDW